VNLLWISIVSCLSHECPIFHRLYHYASSPVSHNPPIGQICYNTILCKIKASGIPPYLQRCHSPLRIKKELTTAPLHQILAPLPLARLIRPLGGPRPAPPRERNPALGGGGKNPLDLPIPLPPPAPPLPSPLALPLPRRPRKGGDLSDTVVVSSSMTFGSASIALSIL